MREENIEKMNFKELRSEVQLLRDELAIFKRKYEDAIYNLDSDNFGKSFTIEQNNMKAQIKVSAEKIETMVSKTDLDGMREEYSKITQTVDKISTEVVRIDEEFKSYSSEEQTAERITSVVHKEYVNTLIGDTYVTNATFNSTINQTADNITQTVSKTYQTIDDANESYNELCSQITQTADSIESVVSKNISAYFTRIDAPTKGNTSLVEKSMLCLYNGEYYYFNDISEKWVQYPASGIQTMFKQTASGFALTGDVSISGDLITDGSIKGLTIGTAPNIWGDGVWLNSETERLEVFYSGVAVGSWGYSDGGSTIQPQNGATLYISDVDAKGEWDFTNCTVIGLSSTTAVFG